MSNIEYQTKSHIQILNIEYQTTLCKSNIQIQCRISDIKLNFTFKFWMSNIEYQTKSNIRIECRISNIKLNPTFKSNVDYHTQSHIQILNVEYRISNRCRKSWCESCWYSCNCEGPPIKNHFAIYLSNVYSYNHVIMYTCDCQFH